MKPRSFDIPVIRANMNARMATPSQSEITNISFSVPAHPPKVKYTSHNNEKNIVDSSLSGPEHPLKVKYTGKLVTKLVIKRIGDTAYDSYIAETLMPLRSSIKTKKPDEVHRPASDQCQDHTIKENKTAPSQMEPRHGRPRAVDSHQVVTAKDRTRLKTWEVIC